MQSHIERGSYPLEAVDDRFDDIQNETEMQFISLNDDQTIEFELPTLNEPKHGNTLFDSIKSKQ